MPDSEKMLTITWAFSESGFLQPWQQGLLTPAHQGKCNNKEKVWKTARITEMQHRDVKWANVAGETASVDFPVPGLSLTFSSENTE